MATGLEETTLKMFWQRMWPHFALVQITRQTVLRHRHSKASLRYILETAQETIAGTDKLNCMKLKSLAEQ